MVNRRAFMKSGAMAVFATGLVVCRLLLHKLLTAIKSYNRIKK